MSVSTSGSRRVGVAIATLVVMVGCGLWSSTAGAAPALNFTSFSAGGFNADGSPSTQAGAHPWELVTSFVFATVNDDRVGFEVPAAAVKDTAFDLPAGVVGDPNAVAQCSQQDMNGNGGRGLGSCPIDTQVGYADIDVQFFGAHGFTRVPVFNMVPPVGQPAQLAFVVTGAIAHIDVQVRSDGDYGVTAVSRNINSGAPVYAANVHLWGVPADPSHDADRAGQPSHQARKPFLRNPTSCAGPVTTTVHATSWTQPDQVTSASSVAPAVTGCERVPFAPTIAVTPDTRQAGAAAGLGVDVDVPQNENPDGLATADVKRVEMKLPVGMVVNPSAADGLEGCRDLDFAIKSTAASRCPKASKVGSVTITSPLLKDPLNGSVFLASPLEQGPVAAAAGRMFRLFITGEEAGVRVKLAGSVVPDPVTGQLRTIFDNNPQLPFTNLHLQLVGGSRAPLSTPKACGTYTTTAELTPWTFPAGAPVTTSSSFTIDQDCDKAGKFEPTVDGGLTSANAGGSSSFVLNVGRPDGQQDITGLTVSLPPGVLAHVGSVPLCGERDAVAGTCPAASQIGRTIVASGVGASPVYVPQAGKAPTAVYLAGPYKDAPYSVVVVVPAQAGPFDLGSVTVRAALRVDPVDGHATVVSDALPTMLLGVPLGVQKINVTIDRPGFMANPTNCTRMQIGAKVSSAKTAVDVQTPFQVGGCAALPVKPKLALQLSGKGQTTDGKHPALAARLTMASGQANLKKVKVTLPLSLALDPDNSQSDALCEFEVGRQTVPNCPARSVVGTATAVTPLLNVPVSGPVYFVKNVRTDRKSGRQIKTLPTLAIVLRGSGITLVVRASSEVVDNHLVTTFDNIPDAPVSDFTLNINGGSKSILVVSGIDICKGNQVLKQVTTGQNNRVVNNNITIATPCPLAVVASSHTPSTLRVTVGGLSAGKVTASGSGLAKASRTISTATTATLQLGLSKAVASRLAHGHDVKVGVRVAFTPKGAKKAKTAHKTITIHAAKR